LLVLLPPPPRPAISFLPINLFLFFDFICSQCVLPNE
jgi:hypothetical protein